jgi:hypothetical protein
MATEFTTPTTFPEFDKMRYEASFLDGNVVVKRKHGRVLRGRWEFEFRSGATWVCVKCRSPWWKGNQDPTYSPKFVPEAVALKAREFLAASLAIVPDSE